MNAKNTTTQLINPKTLVQAVEIFSNEDVALEFFCIATLGEYGQGLLPAAIAVALPACGSHFHSAAFGSAGKHTQGQAVLD